MTALSSQGVAQPAQKRHWYGETKRGRGVPAQVEYSPSFLSFNVIWAYPNLTSKPGAKSVQGGMSTRAHRPSGKKKKRLDRRAPKMH